jgi:outer membrane protein OmpA-like peptidoglycan-associated protein
MKIYEGRRGKLDWENIIELPFNSDDYTCVHPALSADSKRLFFSSDMPGGYGGMDIYMVERKGDTWTKPINLGPSVNTSGNEIFPYLHESNYLFFSSSGHGGEGGLDLFMIDANSLSSGRLKSLGKPFNSVKDDLGLIINEAGTRGYFSSDRDGGSGKDDIYMFEAAGSIINAPLPVVRTTVVAFNETTMEKLPDVNIRIFERAADGFIEGNALYDVQLLPSAEGELMMRLIRKNEKDLGAPQLITNRNGEAESQLKPDKNYLLLLSKEGYESVEKLFSPQEEASGNIIRVPMKPKACATIAGTVNVQPSGAPVAGALVKVRNLVTNKEDLLRANNFGLFETCLPIGQEYNISAEKDGYSSGSLDVSTVGADANAAIDVVIGLKLIVGGILKEPIRTGSIIVLENIYYDFDQYIIRQGAARELDALSDIMKQYPSMEIELAAYTDSRGNDKYNLDLSLKRAESARRYLMQKGIAERRIKAFGFGEAKIRNRCTDGVICSEEEHQYNRRTEVKVTKMEESLKIEYRQD